MALVGLHLLILVVSGLLHSGVGRQKACSCYTIEDGSPTEMTWPQARSSCEYYNKSLVAMETLQEWEFITKTIKGQTSGEYNEWHIGLLKNSTTGNWTWINGRPLTIDKWRDYKPLKNDLFALIAREFPPGSYGSFNSIKGGVRRGWICEEKTDNCEGTCTFQYPPRTTTAPTRSTFTELKESTRSTSTADVRTYLSESTTLPTVPSKRTLQGDKNGSTTIIVAASLGALLFVALIVLSVILLLRCKKRRGKDAERPHTTASKQAESQYESVNPVEAAKLLGTPDLNTTRTETKGESPKVECEYAVVNKANRKPKKGDLVYAELADFDDSTNDEKVAQKPAPYESTVYADVVPTDVYHKASPDPSDPTYANVKSRGV